ARDAREASRDRDRYDTGLSEISDDAAASALSAAALAEGSSGVSSVSIPTITSSSAVGGPSSSQSDLGGVKPSSGAGSGSDGGGALGHARFVSTPTGVGVTGGAAEVGSSS
ncbi:unnamed protein product, partial [Laminaria digitata]